MNIEAYLSCDVLQVEQEIHVAELMLDEALRKVQPSDGTAMPLRCHWCHRDAGSICAGTCPIMSIRQDGPSGDGVPHGVTCGLVRWSRRRRRLTKTWRREKQPLRFMANGAICVAHVMPMAVCKTLHVAVHGPEKY